MRICLLDFSKAFDRIDYNILLHKLQILDVHPVLINWVACFLLDRQQRTRVGHCYSSWKFVNAGVPQGTKLGPLLFLLMANDLKPSENTVKYVDDTTVWEVLSKNTQSCIPSTVAQCAEWASRNNMKLNPTKTKEVVVNFSTRPPSHSPIVIDGTEVDLVSQAKLLGVVISSDLKWNQHVDAICKKASKRLYALRLLKRSALPEDVLITVYRTIIRPILEYACEAWHYSLPLYLSELLERIQNAYFI